MVFVRHALPGERVVVEVTEGSDGDRFWRGDAVSVLDRVARPGAGAVPVRRTGRCAAAATSSTSTPAAQRALKAAVVREQLSRLAGLDLDVVVEEVPPTLRWRTRMRYVDLPGRRARAPRAPLGRGGRGRRLPDRRRRAVERDRAGGDRATAYGTVTFVVDPDGFWQSHVEAPRVLVETVLSMLRREPGERVLDLYAGVGLFAAFLADAVGPSGRVVAVEGSRDRLPGRPREPAADGVRVEHGPVDRVLASAYDEPFDLVVLDPPREGARRTVVEQIVDRAPRAVAYVACDPAALARDLATFAELGYAPARRCAPSTSSR